MPLLITRESKLLNGQNEEIAAGNTRIGDTFAVEEIQKMTGEDKTFDDIMDAFVDGKEFSTKGAIPGSDYIYSFRWFHHHFLEKRLERLKEAEKLKESELRSEPLVMAGPAPEGSALPTAATEAAAAPQPIMNVGSTSPMAVTLVTEGTCVLPFIDPAGKDCRGKVHKVANTDEYVCDTCHTRFKIKKA